MCGGYEKGVPLGRAPDGGEAVVQEDHEEQQSVQQRQARQQLREGRLGLVIQYRTFTNTHLVEQGYYSLFFSIPDFRIPTSFFLILPFSNLIQNFLSPLLPPLSLSPFFSLFPLFSLSPLSLPFWHTTVIILL